jgi:predicted PurR-regulated permease PerM
MNSPNRVNLPGLQDKTFLFLVLAVSLAFAWILWPFFGAVLWGTILAIVFAPLYQRLQKDFGQRSTLAAITTLTIVLLMVILPFLLIGGLLIQEALGVFEKFQSGELNFGRYFQQVLGALPAWVTDLLQRFGLSDLGAAQDKLSPDLMAGSKFLAAKAVEIGQNTFDLAVNLCIVLYLLFFLLRDGEDLANRIRTAIPLRPDQRRELFDMFTTVTRATVKGNVVTAIVQGVLGGLIFWILNVHAPLLWAVIMAFLSLLPAIGSALIWLPVAIYFLLTGAIWQGIVLLAFGVLVIGLVDNVLRPILVGKDTKMPDYIVLISTLGGIAIFGLNGFVIGPLIAAMFISVWEIFAAARVSSRE